jgi:Rrf2 family iron-sulfur cluster assembly transcriptional regulator
VIDDEVGMVSQTAVYALQAVLLLARAQNERPLPAAAIARQLKIPSGYLAKTLHRLRQEGVLTSSRGARGGYRLAERPEDLPLARILAPFQEFGHGGRCLHGGVCDPTRPCTAHDRWTEVTTSTRGMLEQTTVEDLLTAPPDHTPTPTPDELSTYE